MMKVIRPIIDESKKLYLFFLNPIDQQNKNLLVSEKLKGTWRMFVVKMALTIIIGVLLSLFDTPSNETSIRHHNTFSPLKLVFIGILFLPLLEETAFRLALRFNKLNISLALAVFTYYLTSSFLYDVRYSELENFFLERIVLSLSVGAITFLLTSIPAILQVLEHFWNNYFRWILYVSCLGFATAHIINYSITSATVLFIPLILLPKFIGAFCYGYIRINYGFMYSLALHFFWNSIGIIMSLIPAVAND